ncbi:MAB_1171c family putative transporter [Streptomyces sp. NPDC059003]|uniref:MAB_1171c family putative transporter n=1 Tax=Streptomyces sp. NPDC059003 TaxID=3346691 RepID=UPI00369BCF39
MTAVAIWRSIGGSDARRRSLWGCFLGFSISLWTKTEVVRIGLNNSSITDASVLLKHYSAGAALLAIMYYIVAVYGHYPADGEMARAARASRFIHLAATKTALASFALMTVMFFTIVDRSKPSNHFVSDHAGQWGATAYMTVFYVYLGCSSANCLYQWAGAFRREERGLLRVGLGMMACSMLLGVIYAFGRMLAMWFWLAVQPSEGVAQKVESSTEAMQLLLFVLFALGVSVPASEKGLLRVRSWLSLARLYPMWRELMEAFPNVPMEPPRSRFQELTRRDMDAELRLDRWIHDVADAIEKLRHHVPNNLMAAAKESTDHSAVAQAYWIKAALAAKEGGAPAGSVAAFEQPVATDQAGEVAWLRRVARAYKKSNPGQAQSLLAAAGADA